MMGHIVRQPRPSARQTATASVAAKLVVFCNAPEDNPFMAGAFHGAGRAGLRDPRRRFRPRRGARRAGQAGEGCDLDEVAELIKTHRLQDHPHGPAGGAARPASELGVPFGIVDLSLAPTPALGDSVAQYSGGDGAGKLRLPAAPPPRWPLLNDAVKKGGVMASSHVGGLSGAFIPVSEDAGMIDAARARLRCSLKSWRP